MTLRSIAKTIPGYATSDGAGVAIKRSIGARQSLRADPFLMLDAFGSDNPDDYIAGFPPHPHRGFETVTYMLDGTMLHRDHMGNEGLLKPGGIQWMTAGKGVIHEERPKQTNGLMRGFQLWVNLPAAQKMKPAHYQNIEPEDVPLVIDEQGVSVRVVAGEAVVDGQIVQGPVSGVAAQPVYMDVRLPAGKSFTQQVPEAHTAVVYPFEGDVTINGETASEHSANILSPGDTIEITAPANQPAACLVFAGAPIGEPIAQYGPFVMNTQAEIEQAMRDYRDGVLTD